MVQRILIRFGIALWALLLGVFLPYVPVPFFGHLQNLPWGFLYGLGLFLTDITVGNSIASKHLVFGILLWPLALTGLLFWLSNLKVFRRQMPKVVLFLFITSFCCIPVYSQTLNLLPTYWRLMFVVW